MRELLQIEVRDEKLPLYTLEELSLNQGIDKSAWVCLKGVIYDVSKNEVYHRTGEYNRFAG